MLDIGCGDGILFQQLGSRISGGIGIDPSLDKSQGFGTFRIISGWFPNDLPDSEPFDVITMLAVLEHIPEKEYCQTATACERLLRPGGCLIITVPSPLVDRLLSVMKFGGLIDGMELHQHHGFDPGITPSIFSTTNLSLVRKEKFQLGLNNLFLFRKAD